MEKYIQAIILVTIFSLFSSCSKVAVLSSGSSKFSNENTVMLHWLELDQSGIVRLSNESEVNASNHQKPFNGRAIETFEQSPTKSVSEWKNGLRDGVSIEYFYNGRKRKSIEYSKGKRNGVSKEYRITGELLFEEEYLDDELHGSKSEWHTNGVKILLIPFKHGKPHGEMLEWYPDGQKKTSTLYRHGLREGPSSEWYPTGQQKMSLFYQRDEQHGNRTIWYENGKKRLSAQFIDNKMEGNSKGWFPNGKQQFDYNFKDNLEHGICTEWNDSGEKISEIRFDSGVPIQNLLTGKRIDAPVGEILPSNSDQSIIPEASSSNKASLTTIDNESLTRLSENNSSISDDSNSSIIKSLPSGIENKQKKGKKQNSRLDSLNKKHADGKGQSTIFPEPQNSPKSKQPESTSKVVDEAQLPPPPPPPATPTFDPFGSLPSDTPVPTVEEPQDPQLNLNSIPSTENKSTPPTSDFDPFSEGSPSSDPFDSTDQKVQDPFDIPVPPSEFDPFGEPNSSDSNLNIGEEQVPLEDIFETPPTGENKNNSEVTFPEAAPPPATFDPFAE